MTCQVQLLRIVPQCGPMYFSPSPRGYPLRHSLSFSSSLSPLPLSLSLLLTPSYTIYLTPFHPLSHGFIMSPPAISGPKVRTYMRRAIACYLSLDSRQTWRTTIAVPIYTIMFLTSSTIVSLLRMHFLPSWLRIILATYISTFHDVITWWLILFQVK